MDRREVERLAALAGLRLGDDELSALAHDLEQILGMVATLTAVDVSGVEAAAEQTVAAWPRRGDDVVVGLSPAAALRNAPQPIAGCFAVPKIID